MIRHKYEGHWFVCFLIFLFFIFFILGVKTGGGPPASTLKMNPGRLRRLYGVSEIEQGSATRKANVLHSVLSFWPQPREL